MVPKAVHVSVQSGVGNQAAGIDAELDHLVAVIEKKLPKSGSFTLFFKCHDWQIKCYEKPSHFAPDTFHGLYNRTC